MTKHGFEPAFLFLILAAWWTWVHPQARRRSQGGGGGPRLGCVAGRRGVGVTTGRGGTGR